MDDEPELHLGYTADQLRVMMQSGQLPNAHFREALLWLGEQERKQIKVERENEIQRAKIDIAANKRDNIAAAAAIIAAIAAIVGAVISLLSWLFPIHPPR